MEKLFENVNGNQFKLISEGITEDEPKSSLIRKGLRKVFSEGEKEYSYKKLQGVGLGYIRNVSEAKKCALKEARELALEFGYKDEEEEQKFVKKENHPETDMSNPEESREVKIGKAILQAISDRTTWGTSSDVTFRKIKELAQELIKMHGQ